MPASKVVDTLRHEPSIDEADFSPRKGRKSGVIVKPKPKPRKTGKGKRSVEDMIASMATDAAKANYALERIAALEDQIAKILLVCGPEARALVLKERKSLAKYAPEE